MSQTDKTLETKLAAFRLFESLVVKNLALDARSHKLVNDMFIAYYNDEIHKDVRDELVQMAINLKYALDEKEKAGAA